MILPPASALFAMNHTIRGSHVPAVLTDAFTGGGCDRFGDCSKEEFLAGVNSFGEAASKSKGPGRRARASAAPGRNGK